ncbi:MAG: hypothetical protein KDC98_25115 [Planctomycetes bacterium]|nr:hypothetical protein [Planctomycetota bacterium]
MAPRFNDDGLHERDAGDRRWDRLALFAIGLAAIAVFVTSLCAHPRLVQSGEYDQYLQIAEALQQGRVPDDVFHPLFYPLVVAVVGFVTPSVFVAGKLVTAAAMAGVLFVVHRLLRRERSAGVAALGTVAIAAGPAVWIEGMLVATDMTATALVLLAYALVTSAGLRVRGALLVGILAGAAATTRYNLALHAVILLAIVCWRLRCWRGVVAVAAGGVIGSLPHALVRYSAHGVLFASDSWQNIVLKYGFARDMVTMRQQPEELLAAMLRDNWPAWTVRGLGDFVDWLATGLPRLQLHGGYVVAPSLAVAVLAVLGVAFVAALIRRRRTPILLAAVAIVHAVVINVVFIAEPRIMMPATILLSVVAIASLPRLGVVVASAMLLLHLSGGPAAWRGFRIAHSDADVAAARAIVAEHGPLVRIAGSYPFLDRELECAGAVMVLGFGGRAGVTDDEFWQRLDAVRSERAVSWFVLGRLAGGSLHRIGREIALRPGWTRVRADADVVVLHYRALSLELGATPAELRTGEVVLHLNPFGADPARCPWIGVVLRGPDGSEQRLALAASGNGHELRLPHSALAAGEYHAVPVVLLPDGSIEQGAQCTFVVVE